MSIPILNNLNLSGNQLLNAGVQQLASDPGTPFEGQVWENTTSKRVKAYLNAAIVTLYDSTTRLDQVTAPTAALGLNAQKITGLADGTAATDAATLGQVNAVIAGLDYKASVRAATTAAGTLATSFANGQTVDAITLATGDRILVKNQAAAAENGIRTVNASGAPTRATDMDAWLEIPGSVVAVEVGTANADSVWLATADQGGTLDTTAVTFSKLGPSAGGGTAKFAADITGDATATQFTVTHNLGSTDVLVAVYDVAADLAVIVDVKRPTANTVRIDFAVAPANAKAYRCVVVG